MKRWRNIAAAFAVALCAAGTAGAASVRLPDAAGTMLLLGRWESRYGAAMVVTAETMDGVPYRIERVCDDGWDTVVYLRLADEKKTELAFTLPPGQSAVCDEEQSHHGPFRGRHGLRVEKPVVINCGERGAALFCAGEAACGERRFAGCVCSFPARLFAVVSFLYRWKTAA